MLVLLPDTRPADLLALGLERAGATVERHADGTLLPRLLGSDADLALVPPLAVLRGVEDVSVLPAVALSAWDYPYARLFLRGDFGAAPRSIVFDPRNVQEVLLLRTVLREHYGFAPAFVPAEAPSRDSLNDHDAVLLVGDGVPALAHEGLSLDLGQEWYELSNYPLVLGLFATRHGEATVEMLHTLRRGARLAEALRPAWLQAHEMPPALYEFHADSLRFRYDDLATAGLTEFVDLLFQQGALDEIPTLPLATFPDEAFEDDEEDEPLM
jgi:chorismate dehydratase